MNRTSGAPKGRHEIARGVSPWNLEFLVKSPVRAAQSKSKKRVMTPAMARLLDHFSSYSRHNTSSFMNKDIVRGIIKSK